MGAALRTPITGLHCCFGCADRKWIGYLVGRGALDPRDSIEWPQRALNLLDRTPTQRNSRLRSMGSVQRPLGNAVLTASCHANAYRKLLQGAI